MYKALKLPINYLADFGLLTAAISCSRWWGESSGGLDSNIYAAGALVSGGWLLSRWIPSLKTRQTFQHIIRQSQGLRQVPSGDPDMISHRLGFKKPPPSPEFVFKSGSGALRLPAEIPQSEMLRFLRIGYGREASARGQRLGLLKAKDTYQPVKKNAVLSAVEFTKRVRPKFFESEYKAIIKILIFVGLVDPTTLGNGKAPRLFFGLIPLKALEWAMWKWTSILSPAPHRRTPWHLFS